MPGDCNHRGSAFGAIGIAHPFLEIEGRRVVEELARFSSAGTARGVRVLAQVYQRTHRGAAIGAGGSGGIAGGTCGGEFGGGAIC
jgi:hypothetical protein